MAGGTSTAERRTMSWGWRSAKKIGDESNSRWFFDVSVCYTGLMIQKIVKKMSLQESSINDDLTYWLGKTPEERISAVEILRRQQYGNTTRLQRIIHIIKQTQG
jgi:hypothetical protein